jgi:hypothetical protein
MNSLTLDLNVRLPGELVKYTSTMSSLSFNEPTSVLTLFGMSRVVNRPLRSTNP